MKTLDTKLITAGVIGVILSLMVIFYLNTNPNVLTFGRRPTPIPSPSSQPDVTISVTKDKTANVDVLSLAPLKPEVLSGFSLRLLTDYKNGIDYNAIKITPGPAMIQAGWSFPIKQVTVDAANGQVMIDISGVDISTSGFPLYNKTDVATIDFSALRGNSGLTFTVDTSQTKILAKDASLVNYNFIQQ